LRSKYIKRLAQTIVVVVLGLGATGLAAPLYENCNEFFSETWVAAYLACGGPVTTGECYCIEGSEGIIEAYCEYFCIYG
jgi:hypothetical protein